MLINFVPWAAPQNQKGPQLLMAVSAAAVIDLMPSSASPLRVRIGGLPGPFRPRNLCRIFHGRRRLLSARTAASRPPPSQPSPDNNFFPGLQAMFSRAGDGIRIFIAVLFWMSLFFWGSAWDGRDNDINKGPRIRRK